MLGDFPDCYCNGSLLWTFNFSALNVATNLSATHQHHVVMYLLFKRNSATHRLPDEVSRLVPEDLPRHRTHKAVLGRVELDGLPHLKGPLRAGAVSDLLGQIELLWLGARDAVGEHDTHHDSWTG